MPFPLSSTSTKPYGQEISPQVIHAGIQPTAPQKFLCVPLTAFPDTCNAWEWDKGTGAEAGLWGWAGGSGPALLLSSMGLAGSSSSFGSGWISKNSLSRAEQAQPATKLGGFLHSWCSSLSTGCGAGWGKLCSPPQTFVGLLCLLYFHYFPLGEEECPE